MYHFHTRCESQRPPGAGEELAARTKSPCMSFYHEYFKISFEDRLPSNLGPRVDRQSKRFLLKEHPALSVRGPSPPCKDTGNPAGGSHQGPWVPPLENPSQARRTGLLPSAAYERV